MCGVTGFWGKRGVAETIPILKKMSDAISHRGPDDMGTWEDKSAGLGLAHRRLSIIDLSKAGHQPMISTSGQFVISFNGEIYNHLELRQAMEGMEWRGHSDTETLLAAIQNWGVQRALTKCVGMFAFALWDQKEQVLTLARDRLGEKPLYYGWQQGVFLFGSELKALKKHPAFVAEIDRDAVALYLRHKAIPAPYSIYKGIKKLPPGCYLQVSAKQVTELECTQVTYWSARDVAATGQSRPFAGSDDEASVELEKLLSTAIAGQMLADVPLGAFLSGGVDSSLVVALMQANSNRPVRTFTIGFNESGYDEAESARAVASHLRTDHTELYVGPKQAQAVVPLLPTMYDEPFGDSSQIPTYLVSSLARQHVTVSLSGDGGDELFGGYNRYLLAHNIWTRISWLPRPLRAALSRGLESLPPATWDRVFQSLDRWLPSSLHQANAGDKLHKLADVLSARSPEELYRGLVSHWKNPNSIVVGGKEPTPPPMDFHNWSPVPAVPHRMMYLDTVGYLPDDILAKVDRAAMSVSLETRVPFLDHRVLEFAWTLPLAMKLRNGQGKWLPRQLLYKHVPKTLIERPKMGFGVPLDAWLRGALRPWAEDLLRPDRIDNDGFFRSQPIQEKWAEHQSGKRNCAYELWDILMFQAWRAA